MYVRSLPTETQPPLNPRVYRPSQRIAELVPLEETVPLASGAAHRVRHDQLRRKPISQSDSTVDEDDDLSDPDRSDTGNHRGRSNVSGGDSHRKKYMTIEEREAVYNQARAHIFNDFEEREKSKEMSVGESSTSSQVFSSDSTRAVKDDRSVQTFTAGSSERSLSGPTTHDRGQSGEITRKPLPPRPPGHEGSYSLRLPPLPFYYTSIYGPPSHSSDQSQHLGYQSSGYPDAHMRTNYPEQALGQDPVPQYPYYQPRLHQQQRVLFDPTLPSTGGPMLYPSLYPQLQQLPYSSQSPWLNSDSLPQLPHMQSATPTLSNGGDDYPRLPNPSSRAPSQGSGLLNPCDLFVEVRCPLTTYNDTTDIFTSEPRRINHL